MKQKVGLKVGDEPKMHRVWVLGLALALGGCASSDPRPGPLVFPGHNVGYGYSSLGSMVGVVGQDPAETAAINPFDPIALNNLAVTEAARGRYQQASSLLQRAVRLAPARADIAANLSNLQRWLALAEGQAALGLQPQPLQLPYKEMGGPDLPPLWAPQGSPVAPPVRGALPVVPPGSR